MTTGERVQQLREERGFTRQQLARAAGIHVDYVYKIEGNKRTPHTSILNRIAFALGVSVNILLGKEDSNEVVEEDTNLQEMSKLLNVKFVEILTPYGCLTVLSNMFHMTIVGAEDTLRLTVR